MLKLYMVDSVQKELKKYINPEKKEIYPKFFKTGKGEYGYGDIFWGITVPNIRSVAKKFYKEVSLNDVRMLISNEVHEVRLLGYIVLVYKYEKADRDGKEKIYNFYLNNLYGVNNWDIVDLSCYKILGDYLLTCLNKRYILYQLANSKNMWEQRIAIVSTYALIKNNDFNDTLQIAKILLNHKHDLIHKAVGWMLREVGKRDIELLREFLNSNIKKMPRTTLRYALEKMDEKERKGYLAI
jgi:3-methyladenine DNA glycosylase AlkD